MCHKTGNPKGKGEASKTGAPKNGDLHRKKREDVTIDKPFLGGTEISG